MYYCIGSLQNELYIKLCSHSKQQVTTIIKNYVYHTHRNVCMFFIIMKVYAEIYSSLLYDNFSVVATVDFEQSSYSVNEFDGSVQPVIVSSNPLSYDITVQVLGEYQY